MNVIINFVCRLEDMYEEAEEQSKKLQESYQLQDEWRKRGDDLLSSMIPKSVGEQLKNGVQPIDTCQVQFFFFFFFFFANKSVVRFTVAGAQFEFRATDKAVSDTRFAF